MQLSLPDVARLFDVDEATVYRWVERGDIPFHTVNRQCRFNRAELIEWAAARRLPLSSGALARAVGGSAAHSTLCEALESGSVLYAVPGEDKPAVMTAVIDALQLPAEIDRAFLHQMLLHRKRFVLINESDGIAIPHVRNPIVLDVDRPILTLAFLARPVLFDPQLGAPVRALFTLVTPSVRAHLNLLARLTAATCHSQVREALAAQSRKALILDALRSAEAVMPG